MRSEHKILVGIPEGKRLDGKTRHRLENAVELDLKEVCESVDWIHLAEEGFRLIVFFCEHGNNIYSSKKKQGIYRQAE
jgi:hypothetical protein